MKDVVKERIQKFAPWVGFPFFYLCCLVLFASWTFPYDKIKERIVLTYNKQQRDTNGTQELRIDELTSYRLTGAAAKGIHLVSPAAEAGKPPTDLKIDEARVRLSILGLMFFLNYDYSFRFDAFGGTIRGTFDDRKDRRIEATIEDVDLALVDSLKDAIGVPLEGKLSGELKLLAPEQKLSKANGSLTLEAKDVAVGDGKAKLKGALALPRMQIGTLALNAEAKEGVLKLTKLGAGGKDLELQGEGRVQLRETVNDSPVDVNARFKINDNYRSKNDITKSLFGAPGSTMPALFEMDAKVKQSKRQDGFYGWHLRGTVGKLDYDPAPFAGGAVPAK